eukprot:365103-Chlamydomonas_euryale.AAC.8
MHQPVAASVSLIAAKTHTTKLGGEGAAVEQGTVMAEGKCDGGGSPLKSRRRAGHGDGGGKV